MKNNKLNGKCYSTESSNSIIHFFCSVIQNTGSWLILYQFACKTEAYNWDKFFFTKIYCKFVQIPVHWSLHFQVSRSLSRKIQGSVETWSWNKGWQTNLQLNLTKRNEQLTITQEWFKKLTNWNKSKITRITYRDFLWRIFRHKKSCFPRDGFISSKF